MPFSVERAPLASHLSHPIRPMTIGMTTFEFSRIADIAPGFSANFLRTRARARNRATHATSSSINVTRSEDL